jgi:hypothetical protein
MTPAARSGAVISACARYRYRLEREIGSSGPVFAFFGVNPSTADATVDDHTVRKWKGFTKAWGGSRFIVGKVFAFRATAVGELARVQDPVGPDNDRHLDAIAREADILVPCWGKRDKAPKAMHPRFDLILQRLVASGKLVLCLGVTRGGDPLHPLALPYSTPLIQIPMRKPAPSGA